MKTTRILLVSASAIASLWSNAAFSQASTTQPAGDTSGTAAVSDDSVIGDIIVTARRREEGLQTTPIAVTAVRGEALERSQIATAVDLQRIAPSLTVATGHPLTSGFTLVSIRGQGNLAPLISSDPAVATYVDGVYIPRPSQGTTDLNDLRRVEVLRGPQGTLFGRNTTGGALNFISNDPVDHLEGRVAGEYGNFNSLRADGLINVPLAENLAARVTYSHQQRDGYGKNPILRRDVNDLNSDFVRAKVKYSGDTFNITLSGDYNHIKDSGQLTASSDFLASTFQGAFAAYLPALMTQQHTKDAWYQTYSTGIVRPTTNPLFSQVPADIQQNYDLPPYDDLKAYGASAIINVNLGDVAVKSITGYRYEKYSGLIDTDGTSAPVIATIAGGLSKSLSQELQLSGDFGKSLSYITGLYISRETGYDLSRSQIFGGLLRNSVGNGENITKGAYAQFNYKFAQGIRFTGGFRYTWDTRNAILENRLVWGLPNDFALTSPTGYNCVNNDLVLIPAAQRAAAAAVCRTVEKAKFSYPAWTFGFDWQISRDVFVYIATRGAAKAGGWNLKTALLPAFKPEKVKDVEAGFKTTLLNGHLRLNGATFYTWKSNTQVVANSFIPNLGITQFIQNNGDTRVWGAELEGTLLPWQGMEITSSLSLLDGKYKKGSFSEVQRIASATPLTGCAAAPPTAGGTPQFDCTVSLSNLPLFQLPKLQLSVGVTQSVPIGENTLKVHFDYSYIGSQRYAAVIAASQQPQGTRDAYARQTALGKAKGYGLLNGRIGFEMLDDKLELYVYGRNLAQKKYLSRRYPDLYAFGVGIATDFVGSPRTVGAGVVWRFGN